MKRVLLIFLSFILFISVFTSCSAKHTTKPVDVRLYSASIKMTHFNIPDSITIYKNGRESIIKKDNSKFGEILKLTDERFGKDVGSYKYLQTKEEVDKIKETQLVIQFNYSQTQKSNMAGVVDYKGAIFPLTGSNKTKEIFERNKKIYDAPVGELQSPDKLINLLSEK